MHFPREQLAKRLSNQVLSPGLTSIFLAAPRRTGKSTFVREDLRPLLEQKNAIVVYADLWENKSIDPSEVIAKAILRALEENSATSKWFSGIDNVNLTIAGVGIGVQKAEKTVDLSLTEALVALSDKTQRKIVLIIDEVQHSLVSVAGENALFALKAARDEVNSSKHHGMTIIGTGSNQDKLASLRNSKDQAFYLTPLIKLPFLERDYTSWVAKNSGLGLDEGTVWNAFEKTGYKPEIIQGVLRQMQLDFNLTGDLSEVFEEEVAKTVRQDRAHQEKKINELPVSQWSALVFLAQNNGQRGLFEKAAWEECDKLARSRGEDIKFNSAKMQSALVALQEKKFVWNEKRGTYHIEDDQVIEIINEFPTIRATKSPKVK